MWSAVAPCDIESPAPSARSKHSATLVGEHVYLLGGRNGNLPMKDFWKYNLVTGKWHQLKSSGDKLPALQEHSAVAYKDNIYVFGGEVGFSAGTETPLWVYDIRNNNWRKIRSRKGVSTPKGRRGHTALVHRGSMLIYGGYQDLRGSCSELWAFHFETESWHLVSGTPTKGNSSNTDCNPPARHKHSAVLNDDCMWIYGGMTDLQERSDLWKWDIASSAWTNIKTKINPGPLHSHAACRLPSTMIIFGGERDGHSTNELWRFSFTTETWERILIPGLKPQPRAESVAFTVSELLLKDSSTASLESKAVRTRSRTCNSADRGSRHSSYFPNNRVGPCEKTYVFKPSQNNYTDGSEIAQQYSESSRASRSFLQEITKLSQLNISRLNNKCNYSVLAGCTDSTECLLRQHASPPGLENEFDDTEISTPTRGTMIKSKSAYIIKKKYNTDASPIVNEDGKENQKRRVEFDSSAKKIPRDPISVPNFSVLTLPTPVLTPVEAARLVYLDTDDENEFENDVFEPPPENFTYVKPSDAIYENFKPVKRGESYNSHLGYADNPLYQHLVNSNCVKFENCSEVPETSNETISSTSDYASIETVNKLSSASNYSVKYNSTPVEECFMVKIGEEVKDIKQDGPFGFCNPNYMGPDIKSLLSNDNMEKKHIAKLLNTPDSVLEDSYNATRRASNNDIDELEMHNYNTGGTAKNIRALQRNSTRNTRPPRSLALENFPVQKYKEPKCRASSASRVERNQNRVERVKIETDMHAVTESFIPLYIYVVGGKEQGQVTVFQRPLSIWKLKLF